MTTDEPVAKFTPGGAYAFHAAGGALFWDYLRAFFCLALVIGVLSIVPTWGAGWWVSVTLIVVFGGYLAHTLYRHGLRLEMDDDGLTAGWRNPLDPTGLILANKRRLSWDGLQSFRVRYFSRGTLSQNGWTMVRLVGTGADGARLVLTFDGDHEGFTPVLYAAWETAKRRALEIDEATLANLQILGLPTAEDDTMENDPPEDDPWTS